MQLAYFFRHDHTTTAAEYFDICATAFTQQIDGVFKIFDMPALVRADRNPLHVFLQRGGYDLVHRTVMAEMDHLSTAGLEDAANDVDRRIVAVKQTGGRHKTDFMPGFTLRNNLLRAQAWAYNSSHKFTSGLFNAAI